VHLYCIEVEMATQLPLLPPLLAPHPPPPDPAVQVMDPADADSFYFDPLDCTKVGPHTLVASTVLNFD